MSTRKVLVSPGFGAGWSTWSGCASDLADDPELVRMVEAGEHLGQTNGIELRAAGVVIDDVWPPADASQMWDASLAFIKRAWEVMDKKEIPYCGGVASLEIETVEGRYRITEYDGHETVEREGTTVWR